MRAQGKPFKGGAPLFLLMLVAVLAQTANGKSISHTEAVIVHHVYFQYSSAKPDHYQCDSD